MKGLYVDLLMQVSSTGNQPLDHLCLCICLHCKDFRTHSHMLLFRPFVREVLLLSISKVGQLQRIACQLIASVKKVTKSSSLCCFMLSRQ